MFYKSDMFEMKNKSINGLKLTDSINFFVIEN